MVTDSLTVVESPDGFVVFKKTLCPRNRVLRKISKNEQAPMPRRPLVLEHVCFSDLFTFAGQNCFLEYVLMCLVFISALLFLNLKKCFAFKVMFCLLKTCQSGK